MDTVIYAAMHFGVDFICAWAMFGSLRDGNIDLLVYNFCAFALQMPLGTLLDLLRSGGRDRLPRLWAIAGAALTVVGALIHPALLGLGNALFHVGGGMDIISADFEKNRKGKDLGVFVAPGAVGLYLGTGMGKGDGSAAALFVGAAVLAVLTALLVRGKQDHFYEAAESGPGNLFLGLCCFAVVILRSFVGLSVSFSWKTGAFFGWLAVAAVAMGKMAGGFLSACIGPDRAIRYSLLLAAGCFALGEHPVCGLLALFFFNMSMPVTLYLLARQLPRMPGFSFGFLTFGLFLGFLPVYAGLELPVSGGLLGAAGSLLSLLLLAAGRKAVRGSRVPS